MAKSRGLTGGRRHRNPARAFAAASAELAGVSGEIPTAAIPPGVTFKQWASELGKDRICPGTGRVIPGLRVDGKRFRLDDRPAFAWIYDQIPSTPEAAAGKSLVVRKCTQVGFTVLNMLVGIYLALKFDAPNIGFYFPTVALAGATSSTRFLPIASSIPAASEKMSESGGGTQSLRLIGNSKVYFLWTTGRVSTEAFPMDVILLDEVQEMELSDIDKVRERLSGSDIQFEMLGSTANLPNQDIDYFYRQGSQWRFRTRCPTCGIEEALDDYFPDCIRYDPEFPDRRTGAPGDYRYVCRQAHWIDDPQQGTWLPDNPEADLTGKMSIHFTQMLSPTISPRQIYEKHLNAWDQKNFYNRVLGKPYQDEEQVPVTAAHLEACVAEGRAAGVVWKQQASGTFMGVDHMGGFRCIVIKEHLPDGRSAVIHVEEDYRPETFERSIELMNLFGVQICVAENLPNYDAAHNFANDARVERRVFIASYGKVEEGPVRWGDGSPLSRSEHRTVEESRVRRTVTIDQFKAMSLSLRRVSNRLCLFPDPRGLHQEVRDKQAFRKIAILQDRVFPHLMATALVTDAVNVYERRVRPRVEKRRGLDPHFSYALMLADVAMSRAYGTATLLLPDVPLLPSEPGHHPLVAAIRETAMQGTCGACANYRPGQSENSGICGADPRLVVGATDIGCLSFESAP